MINPSLLARLENPDLVQAAGYVAGAWITADRRFDVTDPATGETLASLPDMARPETEDAIRAAAQAQAGWAAKTAKDRAIILRRWYDLMILRQADLAALMTAEQGKPLAEAKGEVLYAASFLEWFAEEGKRVYGEVIPPHRQDQRIVVLRQPVGVVAAITPWNFPLAMVTRKVGPALAAGCTVVLKPSELTPLCALALAKLGEEAGIPPGVFNVVTGTDAAAIGGALTESATVRKLSFTGSTPVGQLLARQCAATVKKLSLELGGNAPFIVFDDADLDQAVAGAMASKFRNAGQTCVCANRFFVQEGVYDAFIERFADSIRALKVGNGFAAGIEVGPLIDRRAVAKAERLIGEALAMGAQATVGSGRDDAGGTFFQPTLLIDVTPEMTIAREEIFAPVACVTRFRDESDVIQMANATNAGLAAYFYANDLSRVWRVAEALEYGMVGINTGLISTEIAPFGGIKASGLGREGGRQGIEDYIELKYLCMGLR